MLEAVVGRGILVVLPARLRRSERHMLLLGASGGWGGGEKNKLLCVLQRIGAGNPVFVMDWDGKRNRGKE